MTEVTWGESAKTPNINWRMSASLANVPRGDNELAEVTSLERAVKEWLDLDAEHQTGAVLTAEHPVQINGHSTALFTGQGIAALAEHLPGSSADND